MIFSFDMRKLQDRILGPIYAQYFDIISASKSTVNFKADFILL